MATHSSILENPMDRGAWWATGHKVAKSQTGLKWLSMNAHIIKGWNTALGFVEYFPSTDPWSSCPSQTKEKERESMWRYIGCLVHSRCRNKYLKLGGFYTMDIYSQSSGAWNSDTRCPPNPQALEPSRQSSLHHPTFKQHKILTFLPPTDVSWNAHSCLSVCWRRCPREPLFRFYLLHP